MKVSLVAEERDRNINRVHELEATIAELKNAAGEKCTRPSSSSLSVFLISLSVWGSCSTGGGSVLTPFFFLKRQNPSHMSSYFPKITR